MIVLYRISDGGYNKIKPHYVTKRGCFLHFLKIFHEYDVYVFADNVTDETYNFLSQHVNPDKIIRTSLSNAGSFMYSLDFAVSKFSDDQKIYFAEDDYIYTQEAPKIIEEGLDIADYSSGYDHPDKYINHNEGGPNPFIEKGGEFTRVIVSNSRHWKRTNSCCMTFASKVSTLKNDYNIFKKYCSTTHPYDFQIFCDLYKINGRRLISCIPSVSTHGEIQWLAKFIDWENEFNKTNN
jgi:hypothetical protein